MRMLDPSGQECKVHPEPMAITYVTTIKMIFSEHVLIFSVNGKTVDTNVNPFHCEIYVSIEYLLERLATSHQTKCWQPLM